MGLTGSNEGVSRAAFLLRLQEHLLEQNPFLYLFQVPEATFIHWLVAPPPKLAMLVPFFSHFTSLGFCRPCDISSDTLRTYEYTKLPR